MGRTALTPQTPLGPYPSSVGAGALAITFTAADATNFNSFPLTGHEVLLVYNSGGSSYTITIHSVPDSLGRTGDITTYSVAAGTWAAFDFKQGTQGWLQGDGNCYIDASNIAIEFAVLRIP